MSVLPITSFNNYVNFKGKSVSIPLDDLSRDEIRELDKDTHTAFRAREAFVSVPVYKAISPAGDKKTYMRYEIKGDPADPDKNPIEEKHLGKLFGNLFMLDKTGIYHNDLDTGHVFFSKDGKVEIDCFKYAFDFQTSPKTGFDLRGEKVRRPAFIMPSNEDGFEYANLGEYFSKLRSYEKDDFLRSYLKVRSEYHGERAKLLMEQGFDPKSKTVRYERLQEELFKNPSDRVLMYTRDKLEMNGQRRKAFTMWDEGGGACGHQVEPKKRFQSVLEHIKAFEMALNVRDLAVSLETLAKTDEEEEYFNLEKEYGAYWVENLYNDTKGMGDWNFNDNKKQGGHDIFLGYRVDKSFFDELYEKIDPDKSLSENKEALEGVKMLYKNLLEDWTPSRNEIYKTEYYARH